MTTPKIYIASDHAGILNGNLKSKLKLHLVGKGFDVVDLGPTGDASVDYPDYGHKLADAVSHEEGARGILICGTGQGIGMAANKHPDIRAAVISTDENALELTTLARQHNDANVICFGARFMKLETVLACADTFMTTAREEGRHANRVQKINRKTETA